MVLEYMNEIKHKWLTIFQERLQATDLIIAEQKSYVELLALLLDGLADSEFAGQYEKTAEVLVSRLFSYHNLLGVIRQQTAEFDAVKRLTYSLTTNLELQSVLDSVVTEAMQLVKNARNAHIYLYQNDVLRFGASLDGHGVRNQELWAPRQDGATYKVARSKEMMIVEDLRTHPLFVNAPLEWGGSFITIPLMMGNTVVGVMNLSRWHTGTFSLAEQRLLTLLADQAAIAIINARLHEVVSQQALSDTLTGLPNRRALDRYLDHQVSLANRTGRPFAVLMMDLDGFKSINDTWGHAVGDRVLHDIATFLASVSRASDFLARYGGDELCMLLSETTADSVVRVADNIHQRFSSYSCFLPDGVACTMGISGGIAIYPMHAHTASDLLRAADEALYRAKKYARGTFQMARGVTGELRLPTAEG
jgi:diguanylate cyclase (GGDEF)-like protein